MRVALITESPTLPTGFARNARVLADILIQSGHEVVCYGIGAHGETFDRHLYPYTIWAAGDYSEACREMFLLFVKQEKPDILLINYDLISSLLWIEFLVHARVPISILCYLIIDGLPIYKAVIKELNRCTALIVACICVRNSLEAEVDIPVYYFPHLVDCDYFHPLEGARSIKRHIFGDALVVGSIAQNRNRKQLVQSIHAIQLLKKSKHKPILLLHTDRTNATRYGGDNLRNVVEYFGLSDLVHLTTTNECRDAGFQDRSPASGNFTHSLTTAMLPSLTIVERLNLCDVVVVASAFGGFEYSIIEAQACAVPVCVTDDSSIMVEVAGGACVALRPSLFEFTHYGAQIWKISPETIAGAILRIADDPDLRNVLQQNGLQNIKRFSKQLHLADMKNVLNKIFLHCKMSPVNRK